MHKMIDSVNRKSNMWSCKGEIFKSTHDLTKPYRIRKQWIWHYDNFESRDKSINKFA